MNSSIAGKKIAFATCVHEQALTKSDLLAADALRGSGAIVIPAVWDDEMIEWSSFDIAIIRSTWDYHLNVDRFTSWLDALGRSQVTVWNPLPVLRWNMNKRYLGELASKGIAIPRTYFSPAAESFSLQAAQRSLLTDDVVIKPVVSASAWETRHVNLHTLSQEDHDWLNSFAGGPGVIVQEFLPEIEAEGEWSLIFFGTNFSHAVRKRPAEGDFRVQEEMGGTYIPDVPDPGIVRQAQRIVASLPQQLLYARVDGIIRAGTFILIELELLEPALFFDTKPDSANAFCRRLLELTRM